MIIPALVVAALLSFYGLGSPTAFDVVGGSPVGHPMPADVVGGSPIG